MLETTMHARRDYAFTIVEVLIVVMLLGILAMIAIPRFVGASQQARESALATDLQTIRRQIEIYKSDHRGRGPHINEKGKLDTMRFTARLTYKTTADGRIDPTNGTYGPYIRQWPSNPFVDESVAAVVTFGSGPPPRDGSSGWYFDISSGMLHVNSPEGPQ